MPLDSRGRDCERLHAPRTGAEVSAFPPRFKKSAKGLCDVVTRHLTQVGSAPKHVLPFRITCPSESPTDMLNMLLSEDVTELCTLL